MEVTDLPLAICEDAMDVDLTVFNLLNAQSGRKRSEG